MTDFPLSRALLEAILADRLSDRFVCELVWWRLGYQPPQGGATDAPPASLAPWRPGPETPAAWAEAFPRAPQLIAERPASVRLTRSIPAEPQAVAQEPAGLRRLPDR
jgi:hypothetical protein